MAYNPNDHYVVIKISGTLSDLDAFINEMWKEGYKVVNESDGLCIFEKRNEIEASEDKYKTLILQFAASFTLADHLGDVATDLDKLLQEAGFIKKWSDANELFEILRDMGVKTIWDTKLR